MSAVVSVSVVRRTEFRQDSSLDPVVLTIPVDDRARVTAWDGRIDALHGIVGITVQLIGAPECPLPHKKGKCREVWPA